MQDMDSCSVMKQKRLHCGPLGITLKDLLGKVESVWSWNQMSDYHLCYTHKGRFGLGLLCRHWKLRPGDEILMPAYNCGTEVDPFVHYGLKVIFYRVDQKTNIDLQDLLQRVTHCTKVIYVTHYFGWPQDIKALSGYCRRNDIYMIEDCALSLFSNPVENPIGMLGDAAIYSFAKTLPVPDGGVIVSHDNELFEAFTKKPPFRVTYYKMLPLFKQGFLRLCDRIGLYSYLPQWLIQSIRDRKSTTLMTQSGLPEIPKSYYYKKDIENLTASSITRYVLQHICPESVVQQRRENYFQLYEAVEKSKLFSPLHQHLPDDVCPLCLPVLVENREAVYHRLNDMGIPPVQWWGGFHKAFDLGEFPEARYLKGHLLGLPIHQQLTNDRINYIITQIEKIDAAA